LDDGVCVSWFFAALLGALGVLGMLRTPDGNDLNIRSVWFIDLGTEIPRFVTAHPLPKP